MIEGAPGRPATAEVSLWTLVREWGRIGCVGFGGPPAHIALLRELVVERRGWLDARQFQDALGACNLLPGPASTQLAIFAAWSLRGPVGALVGGLAFVLPGLVLIVLLAALFLGSPPEWVRGAGAGAGAAVPAVALQAGWSLVPESWRRAGDGRRIRWLVYVVLGAAAAAMVGPWVVLVLVGCGLFEVVAVRPPRRGAATGLHAWPLLPLAAVATGGLAALAWVAFKVGALSYGGGFVIVPLMQESAVSTYRWMSGGEFLNAVALGQVTPGPVTHTVAVVGYAAAGLGGAVLAAAIAFAPSFALVMGGARHFDRLRHSAVASAFLGGAGPAAIGAILGSAIPLALELSEDWQLVLLAAAALTLLALRLGVVPVLLAAGAVGAVAALAGLGLPG